VSIGARFFARAADGHRPACRGSKEACNVQAFRHRASADLLPDAPDDVIFSLRTQATARNLPFSDYLLEVIADHFGTSREALSTATVIVLDPE
jgi:hypothetical protein